MKNTDTLKDVDFQIKWEGQPQGLWARFLSLIHMNFTYYQITKDELMTNLGYTETEVYIPGPNIYQTKILYSATTPDWVYSNYGEGENNVYKYWTMTPEGDSIEVYAINQNGELNTQHACAYNSGVGVRPIINLLKSAIPAQS